MPLARKCVRCGRTFLAKKDEQYCKQCATDELMAILNKDKAPTPAKDNQSKKVTEVAPVISKTETTESYINSDSVKYLYDDTTDKKLNRITNAIDHPSHYNRGKIEVIDFIEDQGLSFHLGNVIKYIARAGSKGDKLEDLKKARWYLDRYINEVMK